MVKDILKSTSEKMDKAVEHVRAEFIKIRTGKATTNLLDGIKVDYFGTPTPLIQLGNISTPDYHTITVQAWDKSAMSLIERAIQGANLGLNPSNDGNIIRIPIPPLNEERRKEIVKLVKKFAEEGKIAVRNLRRDSIEHLKKTEKDEHISEDDRKHGEAEVQKLTDKHVKNIDDLLAMKEKEIMEV
ncbi:MAG: ribosome recycling factor [Ignavibacteria bacterium]|jgi:ribosome recycling factor|nr:ribosome recycling factor [Ignavibacteria bacterium]MBK6877543.1 ribosome recycling factor [Ignavibacteria bacterium]MBK9225829.1 ribosome recycling factor [Ignavibacteria bacterium]